MYVVDLGRIRPYYRGVYDNSLEYKYLDWVKSNNNSYLYINKTASTGNAPAADGTDTT